MVKRTAILAAVILAAATLPGLAAERSIVVASTTSTENSGLFGYILPIFQAASGIRVKVVAVGTGQAIKLAKNGDADVLLVHHRPSEEKFVADGYGVKRFGVMYNDFVLLGPKNDPAGVRAMSDAAAALARIAVAKAVFTSRGDDSGTHKKERDLWRAAKVDVQAASGNWYRETGAGMGATLNTAAALGAYVLADRGTWIAFANKGDLDIVVEGDKRLFNPYGAILVSPARHPHIKAADGQVFIDWLISEAGQKAIASYQLGGLQLFFPNAE